MRRAFWMLPLATIAALVPAQAHAAAPTLLGLHVTNGSTPFLGDGRLLTTVSPNGDGFRDAAHVFFRLTAPARISLEVVQTDTVHADPEDPATTVTASRRDGSGRVRARSCGRRPARLRRVPTCCS